MLTVLSILQIALIVLSLAATALAQYPAGVHPSICPNYPFCGAGPEAIIGAEAIAVDPNNAIAAAAYQRVAQINQAVAPAALPVVPGLAAHQQAEALVYAQQGKVPATNIHTLNEERVRQAEQLLIQLQAEQGAYYY